MIIVLYTNTLAYLLTESACLAADSVAGAPLRVALT